MNKSLTAAGFNEKTFTVGNVTLNYVVGPRNGPSLILIPAQTGTWESYKRVMRGLSKNFEVFILEIRGHGKSTWTTGNYSWATIGNDVSEFLKQVVKRPAIISGNSSGGLIALWLAANVSEYVSGIVLEDVPLFSAEMPRFKYQDKFVYNGLKHLVESMHDVGNRDWHHYFSVTSVPVKKKSGWQIKKIPDWFITVLSFFIRLRERLYPGQPVDIPLFPFTLRIFVKSLSMFDPDFARSFLDGRIYQGLNHTKALSSVTCPILMLHATWERHPCLGLIGAMDETDVALALRLAPHITYKKIKTNHVIHVFRPNDFVTELKSFSRSISAIKTSLLYCFMDDQYP